MAFTFKPEELFSKGIVYAEFFDPATDDLLGYSRYVADFSLAGAMNNGEVEAGPGNALVMMIPDSARLNITATTADSALNNMALAVGGALSGNGTVETTIAVTATGTSLSLPNAAAPLGGQNGAVCYILTSTGSDRVEVEAASGIAHAVEGGTIQNFTAVNGQTYCVKYFYENSSAQKLTVPSMYAPKVVRAHFAVNCYAKKTGGDVLSSSLFKIRHYVFPYYFFTNPMEDTLSQTATGTVNLSGTCLTYQEAAAEGVCNVDTNGIYGYVVDEYVGGDATSTAAVDGIYFIGLGDGVSIVKSTSMELPVKYSVNGQLTNVSDWSEVTFTAASAVVSFADEHSPQMTAGSSAGNTTVTVSVTNSRTGATYTDTIPVTVTNS